jgi:hypothetical protein
MNSSQQNAFLWRVVVSTSPNPHAGGQPLVGCPRLLIQYIRSYPRYSRPFPYPQPEDAPYRGNRDPHITGKVLCVTTNLTETIQKHSISCADVEGAFGTCRTESVCPMEVALKTNPLRISTGMESILT